MARRRSIDQDFMSDGFGFGGDDMIGGEFNPGGEPTVQAPVGNQDPFGNGQDRPDAFFALSPEEQQQIIALQNGAIAGNSQTAREMNFFGGATPTRPVAAPTRQQPQAPTLPQGVSVEDNLPEHDFRGDVPPMRAPDPISDGGGGMPMQTTTPPATGTGPTRRSVSNAQPALFAESGGARMFGDADGLMGGGRGVVGSGGGGPTPTEMMLAIMRSLQNGG